MAIDPKVFELNADRWEFLRSVMVYSVKKCKDKDTFVFPTFISDGPGRHSCKMKFTYIILRPLLLGNNIKLLCVQVFFFFFPFCIRGWQTKAHWSDSVHHLF